MVWPQHDFPTINILMMTLNAKDLGQQFFFNLGIVPFTCGEGSSLIGYWLAILHKYKSYTIGTSISLAFKRFTGVEVTACFTLPKAFSCSVDQLHSTLINSKLNGTLIWNKAMPYCQKRTTTTRAHGRAKCWLADLVIYPSGCNFESPGNECFQENFLLYLSQYFCALVPYNIVHHDV